MKWNYISGSYIRSEDSRFHIVLSRDGNGWYWRLFDMELKKDYVVHSLKDCMERAEKLSGKGQLVAV